MVTVPHFKQTSVSNPLVSVLNQVLANAISVKLSAKQAHWNVKGPNFIALHQLFDQAATEIDGYADTLAERAVQLGGIAEGTLQQVAAHSKQAIYPGDVTDSKKHVVALAVAVTELADSNRAAIDTASKHNDAVTEDLFTEIARGLDKLSWFIRSHQE